MQDLDLRGTREDDSAGTEHRPVVMIGIADLSKKT